MSKSIAWIGVNVNHYNGLGLKFMALRLDCVRNEPQSEPFVGQARLLYRKHLLGKGCRIDRVKGVANR